MTTHAKSSAAAGAAEDTDTKGGPDQGGPDQVAEQTSSDLDALRAELDALRTQLNAQTQRPAEPAAPAEPQDPTHVVMLACGDSVKLPNPQTTHHHCVEHDALVPVTAIFPLAAAA